MMSLKKSKDFLILVLAVILIGTIPSKVLAQNCNCADGLCCSQWGFCGTGDDYCGTGCQQGPCNAAPTPNSISVSDVVTPEFFNGILDQADDSCPGKNFYTRDAFLEALNSYSQFGCTGSNDDSLRKIAAFFAHVTYETACFCYIEEIDGASKDYCDESNTQYPCNANTGYYGRGPMQLSWNYNYGPAGNDIGFDGLTSPETVATNPVFSFMTALWFWVNNVEPVLGQGFGATIQVINGPLECNGGNPATVQTRISYYTHYCSLLGVSAGDNLTC